MTQHTHLLTDLLKIAKEAVRKRGRRLSWLAFAQQRRTSKGYAFFLNQEAPWDVWEKIVGKAASLHPEYAYAEVVDIASEFFNSAEEIEQDVSTETYA